MEMFSKHPGSFIRTAGLTFLVLGFLALAPSDAKAGAACATPAIHGVGIVKSCTSPRNRCATDADCSDGNACNGAEQCATEDTAGSNKVDCTITISNPSNHCDSITVSEVSDTILNGTGSPLSSNALLVTGTSGTVAGNGCDAGSDLGSVASETCTLQTGATISVRANYYTVQSADPSPLNDQAAGTVTDECNGGTTGCSSTPSLLNFGASTDLQSGCGAGTPLNCNDGLFCTDDSCNPATGCAHTAHNCADTDECTIDSCVEAEDTCAHVLDESNPSCVPTEAPGRMTGGGSVFRKGGARVTHGFELHCDVTHLPNNLEINWDKGNNFHLETLASAVCTDDPNIAPPPPGAPFDTFVGQGTGLCNGEPGASITFTLTDAGEPGTVDTATFSITGCPNGLSLLVSGNLKKGNHQAHED
jgi:hypothetical protein